MSELALILSLTTVLLALFVVLTERKFLAYAQRRMGPAVMGRNGALQIALDLIKLFFNLIVRKSISLSLFLNAFLNFSFKTKLSNGTLRLLSASLRKWPSTTFLQFRS